LLYPSLFQMQTGGKPEEYGAGKYEVEDLLRDASGCRDGGIDGDVCCLRGSDGRRGWECRLALMYVTLPREARDEGSKWFSNTARIKPRYNVGERVALANQVTAWHSLRDVGHRDAARTLATFIRSLTWAE